MKVQKHAKEAQRMMFTVLVGASAILTAAPALAERAVKVECLGDCAKVSLGQICGKDTAGKDIPPVAVACDDAADPGAGTPSGCGNGATCTPNSSLKLTHLLSAYCKDGPDYDAIVTCLK